MDAHDAAPGVAAADAVTKPAADATAAANRQSAAVLSLDDPGDLDRASRGLIATHATGAITRGDRTIWDTVRHDFLRPDTQGPGPDGSGRDGSDHDGGDDTGPGAGWDAWPDAPATVHPSLWRQAQLNAIHGLFEVAPGIWQARGYDLSNITFVAGDDGWIVIDPLTTAETAAACLALANDTLGARPVTAVIHTHSHIDHFGGVLGVVDPADVDAGRVPIIAPEGFLAEAVAENVIAGPAMLRRSAYMYGMMLPPGPDGHVDCGLGKATPMGSVAILAPTVEIATTGTEMVVDGVRIVFQNTPGSEAPAEMNFFFPDHRWLCMAENCSHTMHNLYTPRGAQVRDALVWSKYIGEALELFGDDTDIMFASHHWPRWGRDDVRDFLVRQRDVYRWLHDQTMRLANHGETATEIAEQLELPPEFAANGDTRPYYGTVSHNAKAVYQRYLGWFDANPANLQPLPPVEASVRYVEFMGGADAVLAKARTCFDDGDFRWVAQVVNHVVFAQPDNAAARALQADALEQLGYQSESGPWRNFYLTGAHELRHGTPPAGAPVMRRSMMAALTVEQIFDAIGVRLKADEVGGVDVRINWRFTDIGEDHVLGLANRALHHVPGRHDPDAAATVTLTKALLADVMGGARNFAEATAAGDIDLDGDPAALLEIFGHLDAFTASFAIIEP
ncbi:MAG: alkyl/aryl-sulfatase [Acidimicrobiales bacterium]